MKKIFLFLAFTLLTFSCSAQLPHTKYVNNTLAEATFMSFNIRMDTPFDKENSWKYRKDKVAETILSVQTDVIGMQEVLHHQLLDLAEALPGYEWLGVGREDGMEKGEYAPIFYNTRTMTEVGSGYFWLSDSPMDAGSVGWDAACTRIATWAKLRHNDSGKIVFVLNTHFDHAGIMAREESAKLILQKINAYTRKENFPVILTGDFNVTPDEIPYKILTNRKSPKALTDAYDLSPFRYGPEWTFHDFGRIPLLQRVTIDYVFVKNNVEVYEHSVIDGTKDDLFPSDHNPVIIRAGF